MEHELTGQLAVKRFDVSTAVDVTEDFSLPDYIPEVRRVVGVQSSATVDGKYLNGEELEADGSVRYTILYLGGDGGLSALPLTSAFDTKIAVKSAEGDSFGVEDLSLSASPETVTCRVTAPRRLTLGAKVRLRLFSQRMMDCSPQTTLLLEQQNPAGGQNPSMPTMAQPTQTMAENTADSVRFLREKTGCAVGKSLRYNGECGGELREREGTKVIAAKESLNLTEAKPTPDGIAVSGEARIAVLLLTPDGVYTTAKGRCAVEALVPCEEENVLAAAAYGRCLLCEVETGEDGLITWNMEYDLDVDVILGGESEVSVDGYSPHFAGEEAYAEAQTLSLVRCVNGRLTVSGSKPVRGGMQYAGGWGRAVFEKAERAGGRLILTGSAWITALLCGDGDAISEECVIPVRYECDANGDGQEDGELYGHCEITVCDTSGRCDGETLNVTAELGLNGVFLAEKPMRYLSGLTLDPASPVERPKNVLTLCVPEPSESDWDMMKRYRVSEGGLRKVGKVYLIGT